MRNRTRKETQEKPWVPSGWRSRPAARPTNWACYEKQKRKYMNNTKKQHNLVINRPGETSRRTPYFCSMSINSSAWRFGVARERRIADECTPKRRPFKQSNANESDQKSTFPTETQRRLRDRGDTKEPLGDSAFDSRLCLAEYSKAMMEAHQTSSDGESHSREDLPSLLHAARTKQQ